MKLFLSTSTEGVRLIEVEETASVDEILTVHVQIEDAELWLEGADAPLERRVTLVEAEITEHDHLHGTRCRLIELTAHFAERTLRHSFAPAATVEHAYRFLVGENGFDLPEGERAKHHLIICDSETAPDRPTHLGRIASDCALCVNLVPTGKHEG